MKKILAHQGTVELSSTLYQAWLFLDRKDGLQLETEKRKTPFIAEADTTKSVFIKGNLSSDSPEENPKGHGATNTAGEVTTTATGLEQACIAQRWILLSETFASSEGPELPIITGGCNGI